MLMRERAEAVQRAPRLTVPLQANQISAMREILA
jgi:hypothetical protein